MANATVTAAVEANVVGARDRRNALALLDDVVQMAAIADLNQDISASPTEAEVQAISDKVDALLAALRTAGLLAT